MVRLFDLRVKKLYFPTFFDCFEGLRTRKQIFIVFWRICDDLFEMRISKKLKKTSNFKNKYPILEENKSWNSHFGNCQWWVMDVRDIQIYGNYFFSNLKLFLGTKQHLNKLLVIFLTFWWNATKRRINRNRKKVTFFHFFWLF